MDTAFNDEPNEKRFVARGRERKWIKYQYEKRACNNIVLDLFLHDEEGFRRFMCIFFLFKFSLLFLSNLQTQFLNSKTKIFYKKGKLNISK